MNANNEIEEFDSIIKGKACNNNDREVYIQYTPSNFKWNTYQLKDNGKYVKARKKFDSKYEENPIPANTCEYFVQLKKIDPTKKKYVSAHTFSLLFYVNSFSEQNLNLSFSI